MFQVNKMMDGDATDPMYLTEEAHKLILKPILTLQTAIICHRIFNKKMHTFK